MNSAAPPSALPIVLASPGAFLHAQTPLNNQTFTSPRIHKAVDASKVHHSHERFVFFDVIDTYECDWLHGHSVTRPLFGSTTAPSSSSMVLPKLSRTLVD